MNAVIAQEATAWDKESKRTNVEISLSNYTAKARSYTLLANWPQREGATMVDNDRGGRSEMTGVWAWNWRPSNRAICDHHLRLGRP